MSQLTRELDQAGVVRLAELLALRLTRGDFVGLSGELGAGKTTLARALIGALSGEENAEVPSPTFALQHVYDTRRLTITHCDCYRLGGEEARELGLEEAAERGAVIVEWPERAGGLPAGSRYEIELAEAADPARRRVSMRGIGAASAQVARIEQIMAFLDRQPLWQNARIAYLQGDASRRSYARLTRGSASVLLMDAPRQPDGPPIRDGKSYSRIARLADEDIARAFMAVGAALSGAGLSTPATLAFDLERGLLLVEDLGDRGFGVELAGGRTAHSELLRAAVDALMVLRSVPLPAHLPLADGTSYVLPRRDRAAFEIECELLLDWYWPAVKGAPAPAHVREEFRALFRPLLERLLALPGGWFLRDYHSPNLIWLPNRAGHQRVGIIDFQDALNEHFAFDLASLLQDARVDVDGVLEEEMFGYYCAQIAAREADFDRAQFARAYSDFGAQRNTRLLGLWARLKMRDGKEGYLQHIPRTWGYLARNLTDPCLAALAAWYEEHFPPGQRMVKLPG
jgi:tRNA threonylcarbamoyl adenosine modification protein YjeE